MNNDKPILYNLTNHFQVKLAKLLENEFIVEKIPRLPIVDRDNWDEIKDAIKQAIKSIPPNSHVLLGSLDQYQALIHELNLYKLYYLKIIFDPKIQRRDIIGIIPHSPWTEEEKKEILQNFLQQ